MVGADVCGYAENTTETLCARWAMLGAFMPFFRVHQSVGTIDHELYRWPLTAQAGKIAIKARYQLLDYLYTAMWRQSRDGSPTTLVPVWFLYPHDPRTLEIATQFFFGDAILVSPVTAENATDVSIYLPPDTFYDFWTLRPVTGGTQLHLTDVPFTSIPLHVRGGTIIPLRTDGANTTTQLRKLGFRLLVAPSHGSANGSLYLDDGESLHPPATSEIEFTYTASTLRMSGTFHYDPGVSVEEVVLLGVVTAPSPPNHNIHSRAALHGTYNATSMSVTYVLNRPLTRGFEVVLHH